MSDEGDLSYDILSHILSSEDEISEICNTLSEDVELNSDRFIEIIYNIYGLYLMDDTIDLVSLVKSKKYEWNSPCFDTQRLQILEQDDFIENPFEVVEGVLECKCGSKRVFSYTKQTRSADEPMTTFAECAVCKSKWTMKG